MLENLEEVLAGYIAVALWSSNDESTPEGGEPFSANYDRSNLAASTEETMRSDCKKFLELAEELLGTLPEYYGQSSEGYDPIGHIGHDFWLTRNEHGVGFWARGLDDLGDELTAICDTFAECNLYLGDDGLIYV